MTHADLSYPDASFQEREIHLSEYLDVLYKRKVTIILFFLLTVIATMVFTFTAVPVYQSTATLIIDKEESVSPITGERTEFESYVSQNLTFQTHFKLITSNSVLARVIQALKLDEIDTEALEISPIKKIIRQLKENIQTLLTQFFPPSDLSDSAAEGNPENQLYTEVRDKISIEEVRNTRLLNISVKDIDPVLAADMANTLGKKYIEFNLANRMESSRENLAWLNNELYNIKMRLEEDERKFFEYKQQNKVFSMEGKQKVMDQKIAEFNNQYLAARNKRLELDAKIHEIEKNLKSGKGASHVRSLISNKVIDEIYNKVIYLEIEYSRLSKIYKQKHPKITQVLSDLKKSRTRLNSELKKETANLRAERKVLISREKVLEKTIAEFEEDALETSGQELQYSILQRNLNTSQNLYDALLARVKESNVLNTSDSSNIRMVEQALVPEIPVSPKKRRNLLLSLILGLMGGAGLAFFLEYLDQSLRTEEDVMNYLDVPVLAIIPEAGESKGYGYGGRH